MSESVDPDSVLQDVDLVYAVLDMVKEEIHEALFNSCLRWHHVEEVQEAMDLHRDIEILDKARGIISEYLDPRTWGNDDYIEGPTACRHGSYGTCEECTPS